MSTTVEQRVVEMRFDNKQFEQNVQTSMSTLEKLKKSLNLDGAAKGLESVEAAAKKIDMSGISNAVETVHAKFSAMEIVAITALTNITNSAINTGKQLIKSLSVDQVSAGWEKFTNKTTSVGTLIAQGYDLDTVNEQLDRLNWYTDETSYNFTDMVANISKFTATGKGLEESVTAMEGIANWAALSGQNANTASHAMYQLSQAMSAGYMRLEDYKSIQNVSMDTEEFRQKCLDAAVALGTLKKNADGTYKSLMADTDAFTISQLPQHLTKDAWMTSDVMMKVFNDYSSAVDQIYDYADEKGITASQAIEELGGSIDEFGLKAFRAAQEARSWADVVDSVKDAVSTGWMNTFEIIFGNYEEAKELWTDLANAMYDVFAAGAEDRNAMLEEWKELGGRTVLVEAFWTAWENVGEILGTVKEAFREVFPSMTAKRLYSLTEGLKTLAEHLKLSDTASANLKSTFKGLFTILDIIKRTFGAVITGIKPLFDGFGILGENVLGVTGEIGNAIIAFDEFLESGGFFQKVSEGITKALNGIETAIRTVREVLHTLVTVFQTFKDKIKEKIDSANFELLHSLLERVHERMSQIGEAADGMKSGVVVAFAVMGEALANCQFMKLLSVVWNAVKTIGSGIVTILGKLGSSLASNLGGANFNNIIDFLNGLSFGAIAVGITKFVGTFSQAIKDVGSIKESFIGIMNSVKDCFTAFQEQLKAGTLLKIASAIGILAVSIIAISLIDSDKLNASLGAMTILFADLMASMAAFSKISGKSKNVTKSVIAMLGIAAAVLILAGALKKIGSMEMSELETGLIGVVSLTAMMVAAAKIMSSGGKTIVKGATQMVIFAAAIKILASVCKDLSSLSWDELAKGLVGVGVLLTEVSLFMRMSKFSRKSISTATGIVILSAAIKVLASACKDFGQMKWEELQKGLTSIGALLTEIALFTNLSGNAKHVVSTGVALIAIGAAMKIFASAVADFGQMKWEEIQKGLTAMGGALAEVALAVKLMPKNMVGIGAGLVIVGGALEIFADVMSKFSGMHWEEIQKALTVMGGALAELALGLNLMKGTLAGSAALLVASSALLVLTPVLAILGAMSWEAIVKGLVTLAGTFTVLGIAGLLLTPLVPTILALSGSLALIGVAVVGIGAGLALAGVGLSALAVGLGALATAGTAGAAAIVASLTVIITGVAGLIPVIMVKIGEAIVEFCRVIANSAGAIGEAINAVVLTLVDVLVECVPAVADGALNIIAGVLAALVECTPSIVDSLFQFLIAVLEGVAKNLPDLIQAAVDVLMAFFSGVVDVLKGIDTTTLLQGIVGVGLLSAIMVALSAVAALIPGAMVGVLGMGAVIAELALVLAAVGALAQIPGLNWLINEGGNLLQGIGTAIGKFVGGIVGGFMSGVSSQFPQIGSDLSGFMTNVQPFLDGASSIAPSMMDGVKALAETILILTAANILDGITSWLTGGSSLTSFAEEMVPFGRAMKQFSEEVSGIDGETVANAAIAGKTLAEMAATLPNTGGVVGFFAGENDMDAFGEQLIPFGRAMKAFADEVTGLDTKVITEAATAGKAMTEMAATIPNTGGVIGFFAGENDMDAFGEQLVPFGRAMKQYGIAVSGLKADVIQNSVTAGKALMELASTVPNTGGAVSWFTGDNDLDTFGMKLVPFGLAMRMYSLAVTGLDADVVVNSANAAKALVELADNLPNTGGIMSWFTGDNDIASFGESLVSFGECFADYYDSVSNVNVSKLNGVVGEFGKLVDLANNVSGIDMSGMSNFAISLKTLGNSGVEEFIEAFTDANSKVTKAAITMVTNFADAANGKKESLTKTFKTMVDAVVKAFTSKYSEFTTAGKNVMTKFISGVREKTSDSTKAFQSCASSCVSALRNKYNDFYNAGVYLVSGFGNGITAQTWYASAKSKAMANAAAEAARKALDEHSPSKVGYEIGEYFGMGFVNSLVDYTDKSYEAATSIAASAKEGLRNAVSKIGEMMDSGINSQPTIRPVLDLSDVEAKKPRLNALFNQSRAISISSGINVTRERTLQNGEESSYKSNSYNFTQNNYSPKALSRVEIYRQTKNQFSAMERMVEA